MPVIDFFERNDRKYPDEVALLELKQEEIARSIITWKKFDMV